MPHTLQICEYVFCKYIAVGLASGWGLDLGLYSLWAFWKHIFWKYILFIASKWDTLRVCTYCRWDHKIFEVSAYTGSRTTGIGIDINYFWLMRCTVQHSTVQYSTVQYITLHDSKPQYITLLYSHNTTQHYTTQHSTALQYKIVWD